MVQSQCKAVCYRTYSTVHVTLSHLTSKEPMRVHKSCIAHFRDTLNVHWHIYYAQAVAHRYLTYRNPDEIFQEVKESNHKQSQQSSNTVTTPSDAQ